MHCRLVAKSKPQPGQSGDLLPGDTYTGRMKVDVRKTRYMKSLVLSLDSDQFRFECDKTNNTGCGNFGLTTFEFADLRLRFAIAAV
ncbi:MAG: hypothetical protein IPM82_29380 [Saprospiraceae bacterium]|nr:hypothetical protein [Saprospiraceae bacterium]